jgi:two-component system sensor histidine kinase FlrB
LASVYTDCNIAAACSPYNKSRAVPSPDFRSGSYCLGLSIAQNDDPRFGPQIQLAIIVLMNRQMLPSSHLEPMNASLADNHSDRQIHERAAKDEPEMQARSAMLLASAFTEFISASSRLENSYRQLQEEVSELRVELSARNAALSTSLAENERMRLDLQQIVDSMPCGVLVLDRKGEISMINPESGRLLGLDGAHFPEGSKATLRQISAFSGVNLESSYENASSNDTGLEFCVNEPSGKRWLEVRNRPLFHQSGRGGRPDRTVLILRDITAQRRAEQERGAAREARALAEITTILAHEIRNPLASLELFAELIENDGNRRRQWISNLRAGIRTLSGTVNNVLSFHGSGSIKLTPVSLSALIGNAVQFVKPLANQAAVSLEWLVDHRQNQVLGNESALQQVVLNLISNAIRHTPAGGSVTVSLRTEHITEKDERRVIVEFSDTGCGIRPDQMERIFDPGFSGSGDTSGLGLAVCARIMKQHGGQVSACNQIHCGARFSLSLPLLQLEVGKA